MKLTWFGGTTIRIHIGGTILVADPAGVSGVDPEELVSGADATFALDGSLPEIDPVLWQPGRPGTMLDEDVLGEVTTHGLEGGALIAAVGEAPLLLLSQNVPKAGRWAAALRSPTISAGCSVPRRSTSTSAATTGPMFS